MTNSNFLKNKGYISIQFLFKLIDKLIIFTIMYNLFCFIIGFLVIIIDLIFSSNIGDYLLCVSGDTSNINTNNTNSSNSTVSTVNITRGTLDLSPRDFVVWAYVGYRLTSSHASVNSFRKIGIIGSAAMGDFILKLIQNQVNDPNYLAEQAQGLNKFFDILGINRTSSETVSSNSIGNTTNISTVTDSIVIDGSRWSFEDLIKIWNNHEGLIALDLQTRNMSNFINHTKIGDIDSRGANSVIFEKLQENMVN